MNIVKKAGLIVVLLYVVFVLNLCQRGEKFPEQASLILINGKIITVDPQMLRGEAIAIKTAGSLQWEAIKILKNIRANKPRS